MSFQSQVSTLIQQAIEAETFSGAQVLVGQSQERFFSKSYGKVSRDQEAAEVTEETLFDVASLTKPVVTSQLTLLAVQQEKLDLEQTVQGLLSDWKRSEPIKLKHLLGHNSGLADWYPLYKNCAGKDLTPKQVKESYLQQIQALPLAADLGEKRIYSDLGFILLGWILEEQMEKPLDELFQQEIAHPLELKHSFFNPLAKGQDANKIAATENCPWRGKILQGEVHDDNTYVLGGVAGHAGLFSTALDLEKFVHWLWQHWQDTTVQNFVGENVFPKLGWDTVSKPKSQAGKYFSDQAIGHLGFTGCSLWLDPKDQKYIIFLNNSVHPQRHKEAIQAFRPQLQDLLVEELGIRENIEN